MFASTRARQTGLLIVALFSVLLFVFAYVGAPAIRASAAGDDDAPMPFTLPATAKPSEVELAPKAELFIHDAGQTLQGPWLAWWLGHADHSATGLPVSGVVLEGDHYSQWFQYARLDVPLDAFHAPTADSLTFAPLGQSVATRAGYAAWGNAFKPLAADPETDGVRYFPETGHTLRMGMRAAYEQDGVAERLGAPISEEFIVNGVTYQFFQYGAFQWTLDTGAQLMPLGTLDATLSGNLGVPREHPKGMPSDDALDLDTVGTLLAGERWIDVDLSEHTVSAYIGQLPVLVSTTVTGADQSPTPTGSFAIYLKYRTQTMDGVTWNGTPYHEVDVPWVMYFYEDYAVHASTWRTEFGISDSPGCVIPPTDVAKALWQFADMGTRVEVHE